MATETTPTTTTTDDELTTFTIHYEGDSNSQAGWVIDFSAFENETDES